jgi:hypothetical protein
MVASIARIIYVFNYITRAIIASYCSSQILEFCRFLEEPITYLYVAFYPVLR